MGCSYVVFSSQADPSKWSFTHSHTHKALLSLYSTTGYLVFVLGPWKRIWITHGDAFISSVSFLFCQCHYHNRPLPFRCVEEELPRRQVWLQGGDLRIKAASVFTALFFHLFTGRLVLIKTFISDLFRCQHATKAHILRCCCFHFQVWDSYFYLSVIFINQPCLQLESFSPSKRKKILEK